MKKLITAILISAAVLTLTACTDTDVLDYDPEVGHLIVAVDEAYPYRVYVDKATRVMYLSCHYRNGDSVCVMVDAEGNPRIWKGELE